MINHSFDLSQIVTASCLLEIAAPKPGNVHRAADFEDMSFYDMCLGAVAIGPAIESAVRVGVGNAILSAVQATQTAVGKNTNLGTILLLAPLACAPADEPVDVSGALESLGPADAATVYQAINLARPGGLGSVSQFDVSDRPPANLLLAMQAASDRDLIARQYANGFEELRSTIVPWLLAALDAGYPLSQAIVHVQMQTMARFPDSLIARKRGLDVAHASSHRAQIVLDAGRPGDASYEAALADFDFWLRSDGNSRNPGTTADLIAAALFVSLRRGILKDVVTNRSLLSFSAC